MIFGRLLKLKFVAIGIVLIESIAIGRAAEPSKDDKPTVRTPVRIVLAGDSTVTDEEGWGIGFKKRLSKDVECLNLAVGGRSSKSFINEGLWKKCLDAKPDYILIQFGHNDKPGAGAYRETDLPTYHDFMTRYVDDARDAGIMPVLITPLGQRYWGADGKIDASSLQGYVDIVKQVAGEKNVPLVDLQARSIELYEKLGKDGCAAIAPTSGGRSDITHLNAQGSELIGPIVFAELTAVVPELAKFAARPSVPPVAFSDPIEVPLWKDGAPGTEGHRDEAERPVPGLEGRVTNINNPALRVYLPAANQATGAAIVIAPGGGHQYLAIEHEGYQVGQWLAEHGIAGLVLKYRCYRQEGSPYHREDAIADGERAMRVARSRAEEWHIRPDRTGFLGFSAGGDLTLAVVQNSDAGDAAAADPIDRLSSRPDFQVPIYPGGLDRTNTEVAHNAPPTLLICATDDRDNIAAELPHVYLSLRKAGVPVEMHVYASGGHGFGLHPGKQAVNHWPDRLYDWMLDRGLLDK